MRTVIFDLDGTLADTSADLVAAANACFSAMGMGTPLDPDRDAATAFRGGRAMLTLGAERLQLDIGLVADQYPKFLEHYAGAIDVHSQLYPGAADSVQALRAAGYGVGICTNKPEALADDLLRRLGARDMFASLIGADTLPVRKPDPAPYVAAVEAVGGAVEHSLLVGDTVTDRDTARAAGVPCVMVTFGPGAETVRSLEPEALLHRYEDLGQVVSELIG